MVLEQQLFIASLNTKDSMKIIRNFFFISNYLWSNAKISKYGKKKQDKFWSDSLIEKY